MYIYTLMHLFNYSLLELSSRQIDNVIKKFLISENSDKCIDFTNFFFVFRHFLEQ